MKNKKLKLGIAGLVVVTLIGGTLAYFNQTLTAVNTFDTGKYSTTLVETFKPTDGENWEPGVEVNKDVAVYNTGDQDVVVRVKFDEKWLRSAVAFKTILAEDYPVPPGYSVYYTGQANATDGEVALDNTVVIKNLAASGWTLDTDDGWWYYNSKLAPAANTGLFLTSVELLGDVDIGVYDQKKYYSTAATMPAITDYNNPALWTLYATNDNILPVPQNALHTISVTVLNESLKGYSDADYELTITIQTVQATTDAVDAIFTTANLPSGLATGWALTPSVMP